MCIYIHTHKLEYMGSAGLSCDSLLLLPGADTMQRFGKCHEQWSKVRSEYQATERQLADVQEQLLTLLGDAEDQDKQVQAKVYARVCVCVCVCVCSRTCMVIANDEATTLEGCRKTVGGHARVCVCTCNRICIHKKST